MLATRLKTHIKRSALVWLAKASLLLVAFLSAPLIAATNTVTTEQARVELVVHAPQGISPGVAAWLGIIIEHKPDWHTYWKNPGDSGLPTELQWQLPVGLSTGEMLWPLPKKIPIPPLANYGFEGRTLLAVPLKVSPDFKPDFISGKVKIGLQATWLICRRECIPQSGSFNLELPSGASTVSDPSLFEALLRQQPSSVSGKQQAELLEVKPVGGAKNQPILRVQIKGLPASWHGKKLEAFPETTGIFETAGTANSAAQHWEDKSWSVDLPVSPYRQAAPKVIPILVINRAVGVGTVVQATIAGGWKAKSAPEVAVTAVDNSKDKTTTKGDNPIVGADVKETQTPAIGAESTYGESATQIQTTAPPASNEGWSATLMFSLVAAFLGGMLLNLMPCVFPVLTIKILSFAQSDIHSAGVVHAVVGAKRNLLCGGLLYGAGVVLSFVLLAALLLALRSAGQALGWGFQLQSPWVIAALIALFLLIALNLLGVFEFKSFLPSGMASWRANNPNVDHFLSGVLAVLVASPCTAPFMGAALGAALSYPSWAAISVFVALGLGMALPYVLLAAFPAWLRFLPKPGVWMQRFKQIMAIPMLLTVAWLGWVLYQQVTPPTASALNITQANQVGQWQNWTPALEQSLRASQKRVFVDYTAAWCITCQVNKRTTLDTAEVAAKFKEKNMVLLRADWTRYDPEITESLRKLGRSGIPVYVLYAPDKAPQLFTEFLSQDTLLTALNRL